MSPTAEYTALKVVRYTSPSFFLFSQRVLMGYAEKVGGFGKVAVGMGYGGCGFVFLIACFELELNVCAGSWCVEVQFFRGYDLAA